MYLWKKVGNKNKLHSKYNSFKSVEMRKCTRLISPSGVFSSQAKGELSSTADIRLIKSLKLWLLCFLIGCRECKSTCVCTCWHTGAHAHAYTQTQPACICAFNSVHYLYPFLAGCLLVPVCVYVSQSVSL